jgi:hypothetical protein
VQSCKHFAECRATVNATVDVEIRKLEDTETVETGREIVERLRPRRHVVAQRVLAHAVVKAGDLEHPAGQSQGKLGFMPADVEFSKLQALSAAHRLESHTLVKVGGADSFSEGSQVVQHGARRDGFF